ncbi:hypothetical protein N802_06835 [Knoellia sinensis KCTC 19936]|uniref:Uncharacterized protein n=1 Tax=Knoellia sinensis KCTC 19936 TaxID=1385520 RepID=A0A0A0J4K6_9MICO|nr:hypothetical protein [Knoellia sinensis]KGN30526.1 hypothetical protein N802_06835 [Knoellia sinensis KCTC 19936]
MTGGIEYAGYLYYVWGFHGLFLIDAESHTDAQEVYSEHHDCDVTMIEHCMRVPDPDVWGTQWDEPDVGPHECVDEEPWNTGDNYVRCICNPALPYLSPIAVDPKDPRVASIDLEREKAASEAGADQMLANLRDRYGDDSD